MMHLWIIKNIHINIKNQPTFVQSGKLWFIFFFYQINSADLSGIIIIHNYKKVLKSRKNQTSDFPS